MTRSSAPALQSLRNPLPRYAPATPPSFLLVTDIFLETNFPTLNMTYGPASIAGGGCWTHGPAVRGYHHIGGLAYVRLLAPAIKLTMGAAVLYDALLALAIFLRGHT